ncbi:MAG: GTPase Era [Candidatus Ancillula sp.]|jgi:GTP-binding protein Era|nr:GTPase Era [Candidatus Ancillula sp.]
MTSGNPTASPSTKAGFVCVAGRPNVGKSSLVNALVDAQVAITSSKPETTRKVVRGIKTFENENGVDCQLVFVDTPGIHRPRTLLGKHLNTMVKEQLAAVDAILWLTPADEEIGRGDRYILDHLARMKQNKTPLLAVVTKVDKVDKTVLFEHLKSTDIAAHFDEIIPVSAKTDENLEHLLNVLAKYMPQCEFYYSDEQLTDESWQNMCEEVVRGELLEHLNDELPHSLMVKFVERVNDVIYLNLFVERDSQKGIIIGKNGDTLRRVRKSSTKIIREIIPECVQLELHVKVAKNWQTDPRQLRKLGF